MSSVGRISLDLNINSRNFNRQVNGIQRQTTKAFGSMSVAVGNIMANLATKAVASIGNFVKDSIDKGSELAELQNVVDSVFTTMSDKVETFSQNALAAYGLTEAQSKKMIGTYGAMAKSFGYSEAQAYNMSAALTGLTGDVASFYNLNHDEAYTKLKSVFTGETESLKELGVVMTQAALDEFALANGFGKTTAKMSEQEKVALRLAFVQNKLATASGDFMRNQDSWANQTRILTGQFESFKAAIGQGLINVLTPVIKVINVIMAKLVQLANAFKSFTEMIMGKKSGGGAGSAMQEVADAAGEAAGATGGVEDAAEGAASAAKKAQKSLMGFDEINKLTKVDDSSAGGAGGGVSFDDIDFGSAVEEQEQVTNAAFEKIKAKIKELVDLFKDGFKAGLGDDFEASLKRTQDHLKNIGKNLKEIFTDPEVVGAANNWANTVAYSLGQVTGSVVSVGQTIAENLIGGVDKFLEQNKDFIKDRLVGIFDASAEIFKITGNLAEALASIFEVFRGDTAKQITADLLGIFVNARLGIVELALRIGGDVLNCIAQPIIENKDKIKEAIENTLKPISTILSTLNQAVKDTFEKIFEVYDSKVSPMFQSFADGLSSLVGTLLDAYNTYIAPVLDNLGTKFAETWASHIQPAINSMIEFVGKLANTIKALWEGILQPLISWIISTLVPVIAPILQTIGDLVIGLFGTISKIIGGIFDVLGGLLDFIVGVFTGDWELAWEGIRSIFEGIWNVISGIVETVWEVIKGVILAALNVIMGIISTILSAIMGIVSTIFNAILNVVKTVVGGVKSAISTGFNTIKSVITTVMNAIKNVITSVFKGIWNFIKSIINSILGGIENMVNGVIGGLNAMIGALNKLSFDVPDWVPVIGGGTFGFDIPTISKVSLPRLAEGGYVRANQPQPVIVGDNKTQGEIIAPEGKILAITLQALEQFFSRLKDAGYSSNGNGEVGDIIIPIYLDGSMLDEVIVTAQQRRNLRSGGR